MAKPVTGCVQWDQRLLYQLLSDQSDMWFPGLYVPLRGLLGCRVPVTLKWGLLFGNFGFSTVCERWPSKLERPHTLDMLQGCLRHPSRKTNRQLVPLCWPCPHTQHRCTCSGKKNSTWLVFDCGRDSSHYSWSYLGPTGSLSSLAKMAMDNWI